MKHFEDCSLFEPDLLCVKKEPFIYDDDPYERNIMCVLSSSKKFAIVTIEYFYEDITNYITKGYDFPNTPGLEDGGVLQLKYKNLSLGSDEFVDLMDKEIASYFRLTKDKVKEYDYVKDIDDLEDIDETIYDYFFSCRDEYIDKFAEEMKDDFYVCEFDNYEYIPDSEPIKVKFFKNLKRRRRELGM